MTTLVATKSGNLAVQHQYANENLFSVIRGLDIQAGDRVLSICGSGDYAFAMLAEGASVVAVDNSEDQIRYAQHRAKALEERDYGTFLRLEGLDEHDVQYIVDERFAYFGDSVMDGARRNIASLTLEFSDIFDLNLAKASTPFNKVYLSNIFRHPLNNRTETEEVMNAEMGLASEMVQALEPGCLIYDTTMAGVDSVFGMVKGVELDVVRTGEAEKFYAKYASWTPHVFRVVASEGGRTGQTLA